MVLQCKNESQENGREISFGGCVMSAGYSWDGQEHRINSFEDYYKWRMLHC